MARSIIRGTPLSPGIAIGPLRLLPDPRIYEKRPINPEDVETEIAALYDASAQACASLKNTISSIPDNLSEYREIVALQMELARDPRILNGAIARIRHKKICAAWALSETIAELSALFQSMADPYLSDRAQDIRTIGQCLLAPLTGINETDGNSQRGILAAYDLSPAEIMEFRPDEQLGLMTVEGGATSHTAILARALKLPAVGGLNELFREARNGETVILDGLTGEVLLGPDENETCRYNALQRTYAAFEKEARQSAHLPAITRDGVEITVLANLESPGEIHELLRCGAEGVGLFRTEFGWLNHEEPCEEALFRDYCSILAGANSQKVIFRTLDAGADKVLPVQEALHEPNPALGLRGIRFCLNYTGFFKPQLRALLRAGANNELSLMLPMVTTISEIRQFKALLLEVKQDLAKDGVAHAADPLLGVMVETPAAVLICDELCRECDFLSLGTNDLLHYIMAIDRNNRHVSYLHDPLHPAFMRAIKLVSDTCHKQGKKVSVCGELAGDPVGIALLTGLGVDILSATPRFVPLIKHTLRKLNTVACKEISSLALEGGDMENTRARLRKMLTDCMDSEYPVHNSLFTGLARS